MNNTNDTSIEGLAGELVSLNERILQAEDAGRKDELDPLLDKDFSIIEFLHTTFAKDICKEEQKWLTTKS